MQPTPPADVSAGLPSPAPAVRKIIHVDMDAFFASVEQHDRPELRGKPVAVGGSPQSRGVVAAASYEARRFGVRSAISSVKAQRLCPQLIFVPPRFSRYVEISDQVHEVFAEVTDLIEPLSIDEAYLDVTTNKLGEPLAGKVALYLKRRIKEKTGLTASAGVAPNKFLAKIASELRKPDGFVVIPPERVQEFVAQLPVEKLWGVGPVTTDKLHGYGIRTAADIRKFSLAEIEKLFGSFGTFLHELSHGRDDRPVETEWEPKSRGAETTFDRDILQMDRLEAVLRELAEEVSESLKRRELRGRTVTLKVRYKDFKTITRSRTLLGAVDAAEPIAQVATQLLRESTDAGHVPVRLLGVSVKSLLTATEPEQLKFDLPIW
jgi:DNA polymerase-4